MIVCAGVTHREGLLSELENSLDEAGIGFHLEMVPPMPNGPNSMTMRRKINFMWDMAQKFYGEDRIVFADGFDVLFHPSRCLRYLPAEVTFSAEANCYPEPELADKFDLFSPWRFVNAGLSCGSPEKILEWCIAVENTKTDLDALDQKWINRAVAYKMPWAPKLDHLTEFFYTVSRGEQGSIIMTPSGLTNKLTGSVPAFFHFSGKTPTDGFRRMIAEGVPLTS